MLGRKKVITTDRHEAALAAREGASEFAGCLLKHPDVKAAQAKIAALESRERELRTMLDGIHEPDPLGLVEPGDLSVEIERHATAVIAARRDREGIAEQLKILAEQRTVADGELQRALQAAKVANAPALQAEYDDLMVEIDDLMEVLNLKIDQEKILCDTPVGPKTSVANLVRRHGGFPLLHGQGTFASFRMGYTIYRQLRDRR